ncbi:MAG: GIY-YIG nuclease family protein [Candidatus Nanopelagicaceae bacterium]
MADHYSTAFIYIITNTVTCQQYVGQTTLRLHARLRAHLNNAGSAQPVCRRLAEAIRTYGRAAFRIDVLHTLHDVATSDIDEAERAAISEHGTLYPYGYNLRTGRNGHRSLSAETCMKMSESKKGVPHSDSHRANISTALKGHKADPAHIAKMNAARVAKGRSAETRRKISIANKGRPQHPNQVAALRSVHVGARRSAETCARISAAKRGKQWSAARRAAFERKNKGPAHL